MILKKFTKIVLLIVGTFFSCKSSDRDLKSSSSESVISDISKSTVLSINGGSSKDISVKISPNSINLGSKVSIAKLSEAPDTFSQNSNVSSGSDPISIIATDSDGKALSEAKTPMTIQLPINNLGLSLLAVEKTEQNVCVFLQGSDSSSSLYIWRRSKLTLVDNVVYMYSKKFGTYQIVYCGSETIDSFVETEEETPPESIANSSLQDSTIFEGNWISDCQSPQDREPKVSRWHFSGYNTTVTDDFFDQQATTGCEGSITMKLYIDLSFKLVEKSQTLENTYLVDGTVSSVHIKYLSQSGVDNANSTTKYGKNNWVLNEKVDISEYVKANPNGTATDEDSPPVPGKTYYNILRVVDNTLSIGNWSESSATRPTTFDPQETEEVKRY